MALLFVGLVIAAIVSWWLFVTILNLLFTPYTEE